MNHDKRDCGLLSIFIQHNFSNIVIHCDCDVQCDVPKCVKIVTSTVITYYSLKHN